MVKKKYMVYGGFLVLAVLLPHVFGGNYYLSLYGQALINIIVVLGLNFITGLTRNMNLGTAGIMGLGAYTSALLYERFGISPWIGLAAAIVMGFLIGKGLGYPSLRVKGVYLSLTTIAFGEIVRLVLNNTTSVTGGAQGVKSIPVYHVFGLEISRGIPFYYFLLILMLFVLWLSVRIVHSKWGRAFKAISDNPDAAESLGIDISKIKILAFTLASIYASVGGALYAHLLGYINPQTFTFDMSIKYVIMLMIGGIGMVSGNIFGAIVVTMLPELLRFLGDYYQLVFYAVAFVCAIRLPQGWLAGLGSLWKMLRRKTVPKEREGR